MNILSFAVGRDGCSNYRVKNPLNAIETYHKEKNQALLIKGNEKTLYDLVLKSDVILFREYHRKMIQFIKGNEELNKNKLLVIDTDDDIFNFSPYTEQYRNCGIENFEHEGKMLWEDGKNGFDITRNRNNLEEMLNVFKSVDLITTSTDFLNKRMRELTGNENVETVHNVIDFRHWNKWALKKNDKEIRIGWTGGSTHYADWYLIKDGLKEIFDKYDNIKLVLQGEKWDGTLKDIPYEFHKWIDFEGHPYKVASLNIDIAIIPLVDSLFNNSKSCVKWYEFSSLGIPSVVSNVIPYKEEIEDEKTGLLFNSTDEFVKQVSRLIEDKKLRNKIGNEAHKWVKGNRNLETTSKKYLDIFKKYGFNE